MTSTHTPGPWFADDAADCAHMAQCLIDNPTWIAVADTSDGGGHVAYCAPDNARLIAEAPAMLEVLRAIRLKAQVGGNLKDIPDNVAAMFYDIIEDANDMLASIEGGAAPAAPEREEETAICCTACGSSDVGCDAYARWDGDERDWCISTIYDDCTCNACGYESSSSSAFEEMRLSELHAWRKARGFDADALAQED